MVIHPIEFRYNTPEMYALFTEEYILQKKVQVEAALARAHASVGNIPDKAAITITEKANSGAVKLSRVKEIEEEIDHDLMAIVKALSEKCGSAGKYVHLGATSYDIVDTAWALILREALYLILMELKQFENVLVKNIEKYRNQVMVGRTHGQHAIPTTLGFKFAVWATENMRNTKRVENALKQISVGKMSGAVGTQAGFGLKGIAIQKLVMTDLGLKVPLASTQVIQRDRHAEVIVTLVFISQSLKKIAKEIRNLQRPEILEIAEPFKEKQVGSSTMPQKRNPYRSERICGLARYLRGNAITAFENITLEHERDLTNSSNERILFPESFVLTSFILSEMTDILDNLKVYPENMQRTLDLSQGRIMSEAVMISLVKKGMGRQDAHALVRECAQKSFKTGKNLQGILKTNKIIKKYMYEEEIEEVMQPENYLGTVEEQIDKVLKELG